MTRGSQLQVQIYVNRRSGELSEHVLEVLPSLGERSRKVCWTAPLEHEAFAEPRDEDFLKAVGYVDLADGLRDFWPARGPVWDALAVVVLPSGRPGVLLAEGKSYPAELYGGGSKASSGASVAKIRESLAAAQQWIGVTPDPDRWLGELYQSANRIAHLYWLREVARVDAWLVHLLFLDDQTHRAASRSEWEQALPLAHEKLGIVGTSPWFGEVFLPALAAEELVREPIRA